MDSNKSVTLVEQRLKSIEQRFSKLPLARKNVINYNNLVSTVKAMLIKKYPDNSEEKFQEYCLIKKDVKAEDVDIMQAVNTYWTFIQLNKAVVNKDGYALEKIINKNIIGDRIYTYINFLTYSHYGVYLNLSSLNPDNIHLGDFMKILDIMGDEIGGKDV